MVAECQGGGGGGDLLIKLFGKTIPVPESGDAKDLQQSSSSSSSSLTDEQDHQDAAHAPETKPDPSEAPPPEVVDAEDPKKSRSPPHDQKPVDGEREKLKKPDKVVACPRCSSMDTKFCYCNNYNVNQPRHFCKNCQRYWTAGGAMRNVPVGAGRRKNKNAALAAASHFLHSIRDTASGGGGTVLSFGGGHGAPPAAAPVCLDLAEQLSHLASSSSVRKNPAPPAGPCSEGSSNRDDDRDRPVSVSVDEKAAAAGASMNSNGVTAVWPSPFSCAAAPSPATAAYFSSGIAIPIYPAAAPAAYWGCMLPGAWSQLPWPTTTTTVQQQQPPSSPTTTAAVSSSGAAADTLGLGLGLGKHPRDQLDREGDDGGRRDHNRHGNKVWAPKTIRIDDVDEVARSSIWSLIGINTGDKTTTKQQLGMVFEPKLEAGKKKATMLTTTSSPPLLHANPVAVTRSVAFQEGS